MLRKDWMSIDNRRNYYHLSHIGHAKARPYCPAFLADVFALYWHHEESQKMRKITGMAMVSQNMIIFAG
jgi:hypothetical protein